MTATIWQTLDGSSPWAFIAALACVALVSFVVERSAE